MRKDIQRKRNIQKASLNKMLFTSGGIVSLLIIVVVVSFFIYGNKNAEESKLGQINNDKIASLATEGSNIASQTSSSIGKSVNEAKEESNTVVVVDTSSEKSKNEGNQIKNNKETSENKSNKTSNTTIKEESKSVNTEENVAKKETKKSDPVFSMPVEGDVIKEYAKDKLVYSDTLKEWVTHAGIDIKADKTTIVKASEEGKIKSIKNDPRYGLTVVIEHTNGFESVYSNLLTAEFITVGEEVKQGQTIATVGNTARFEIADETHLHFEIKQNGENVDPNIYLK